MMKLIIRKATAGILLLSIFLFLSSCDRGRLSPGAALSELCLCIGVEGRIFSTDATPDGEDYLSPDTVMTVFCAPLPVGVGLSLLLHSKLDSLIEAGAFSTQSAADEYGVLQLIEARLEYLSGALDGESLIVRGRGLVVYVFLPDTALAAEALRSILG